MLVRFINCRLLRKGELKHEDLWVLDGKIIDPQAWFFNKRTKADTVVECNNCILAPGFLDVQINGAFGIDFSCPDNLVEGLTKVATGILRHGVTGFCPTVVTSHPDVYKETLPLMKRRPGSAEGGAAVLGIHLEGPFINPKKKGAHPEKQIRGFSTSGPDEDSNPEQAMESIQACYGDLENVAMVTLAPELVLAPKAIEYFRKNNILVSLGHTAATLAEGEEGQRCGATMITHLFNAMSSFHHRDPGIVGMLANAAILADKTNKENTLFYGLIVDGFHTHEAALRMAHSTHPKGCVLVTDAMAAMGLSAGVHSLGEMSVHLGENSRASIAGKPETLAGSAASMDACVREFSKIVGVTGALEAATLHPAQFLGLHHKGRLEEDCDADLVLLNDELEVIKTFIAGREVFNTNES
eukprot:m.335159 g.335159  ORF g.335159 m.335159 type:complete len:412 (-) comp17527_c0_seq1:1243-2478(-)